MNIVNIIFKSIILLFFIYQGLFKNIGTPKISIFLPIYNKEKYLRRSITSIQNQTLKEIEIIAVNDYSTDKSFELLKEMKKKDKRIKIINNKKNHGLLYSRAMGIINSRGEYLMNIDPDDKLAGNDNLEYLYNLAKKNNLDIISYSSFFQSMNSTIVKCSNFDNILYQPQILQSAFNSKYNLEDYLIWNKLIKRNLFKKALKIFNVHNKEKWNYHEDNVWSLIVNKYAKSMLCTNKTIYIYYLNEESFMGSRGNLIELNNLYSRHYMYTKILNRKDEQKYILSEVNEMIYIIIEKFFHIIKNNRLMKNKLIKIILLMLKDYEITKDNYIAFKYFFSLLV